MRYEPLFETNEYGEPLESPIGIISEAFWIVTIGIVTHLYKHDPSAFETIRQIGGNVFGAILFGLIASFFIMMMEQFFIPHSDYEYNRSTGEYESNEVTGVVAAIVITGIMIFVYGWAKNLAVGGWLKIIKILILVCYALVFLFIAGRVARNTIKKPLPNIICAILSVFVVMKFL